jgi:hypothetical protein
MLPGRMRERADGNSDGRRRSWRAFGIALVAVSVAAVGCTGSTEGTDAPTVGPGCVDLSEDLAYAIELVDYAYHPPCAIVATEALFELPNTGEAVHTFTIDERGIDIEIGPGETYRSEDGLDIRPGVYQIRCTLHPQMLGTIEVR